MKPTIYIAGSRHELDRAREAMRLAENLGFVVALDWTESVEVNGADGAVPLETACLCAAKDIVAAAGADVFWMLLSEHASPGSHVELGVRLGVSYERGVVLSGGNPGRSIFYAGLPHFEADDEVRAYLTGYLTTWRPR